ncbi:hypothetical protein AVEN_126569-1, partial [Araneus ventricosus]
SPSNANLRPLWPSGKVLASVPESSRLIIRFLKTRHLRGPVHVKSNEVDCARSRGSDVLSSVWCGIMERELSSLSSSHQLAPVETLV